MPDIVFSSDKHFLDANILIGAWLEWDNQYQVVQAYMLNPNHERHTSDRACSEAIHVYENYRKFINRYLFIFQEEFDTNFNIKNIDIKLSGFNNRYLEGIKDESELSKVRRFMESYYSEIRDSILGIGSIELILDKVEDIIKLALNTLELECQDNSTASICRHVKFPPTYENYYSEKKSLLKNKLGYENDILIILDAYHTKETITHSDISLITTDYEHMLSNKSDIETILNGIYIESPIKN